MRHIPPMTMAPHDAVIPQGQENATTHFVFLLVNEFSHIAFSCAIEPLRIANLVSGRHLYRWTLLSEDGVSATCSNQTVTLVNGGMQTLKNVDRLFVIAGTGVQSRISAQMLKFLRRERAIGTPLGAICSGVYVLAEAGFLDGVEAAVHWDHRDIFSEKFPNVKLVNSIFVSKGRVITSSGGIAAADMMLNMISEQYGSELAVLVADQMVHSVVREESATQRISMQSRFGVRNSYLMRASEIMEQNIESPISPAKVSAQIGISTRQLERLFKKYLGTTPHSYSMELRIRRAKNLLLQSELSVTEISMACGFHSASHFSKVFKLHTGQRPMVHRPFQKNGAN